MAARLGQQTNRPLGRPRNDGDHPPLTRDTIADAALALVAERGFAALTMRGLAIALNVTVRALYCHVADRQDVIDLLAARIMELQADHILDLDDWRGSIRSLYRQTRQAYRRIGRAVLFAFEETIWPAELPPERILLPERLLAFLTALGLSLEDALIWQQQFLADVFGFALLVDYRYDHGTEAERRALHHPTPEVWLDAHPDAPAPLSREALLLAPRSPDEVFERTIERAIAAIDAVRGGEDQAPAKL